METTDAAFHRLITRLEEGTLCPPALFSKWRDLDIVAMRSDPDFTTAWTRADAAVQNGTLVKGDREWLIELKHAAFNRAWSGVQDAQIANYVADDFRLIGQALLTRINDPWVNALFNEYRRNCLPGGKLTPIHGVLREMID